LAETPEQVWQHRHKASGERRDRLTNVKELDLVTWWNQTEEALALIALDVSISIPDCRS
jgi:hypothetical protein